MTKNYLFAQDLSSLIGEAKVCIIADDSDNDANLLWLKKIIGLCPQADFLWVVDQGFNLDLVDLSEFSGENIQIVQLGDWTDDGHLNPIGLIDRMEKINFKPQFLLTTIPYDAYGVWVKDSERRIMRIIKQTSSEYLIHDKFYDLFKVADAKAIFDRVYLRKFRIFTYKAIVVITLFLSNLFLHERYDWQRIKK